MSVDASVGRDSWPYVDRLRADAERAAKEAREADARAKDLGRQANEMAARLAARLEKGKGRT